MRLVALLACLATSSALGQPYQNAPFRQPNTPVGFDAWYQLPEVPAFMYAPTSDTRIRTGPFTSARIDAGTGLPSASAFEDAFLAAYRAGAWGYVLADGGSLAWDAGAWVAPVGTPAPTQASAVVCPDGPSCAPRTLAVFPVATHTFGWEATAHAGPAGAYSFCYLGAINAGGAGVYQNSIAWAETGGDIRFLIQHGPNTSDFNVFTNTLNRRSVALPADARALICVTCNAAQTSGQVYINGTATGAAFTCATGSTARTLRVSGYGDNTATLVMGNFEGAFYTEQELSSANIAAIARAVLADQSFALYDDGGVANESHTRATTNFCDSQADGDAGSSGTLLGNGRACVSRRGLAGSPSAQNVTLRSAEWENASWATGAGGAPNPGVPTKNGTNVAISPAWTLAAERIDFPAVSGTGFSVVYQGHTGTAASWSHGVYLKGVSGSGTIYLMSVTGATYNTKACAYTATEWTRCGVTGTETATTWYYQLGVDLRDAAQSAKDAQSVYVWGGDSYALGYLPAHCPTTSAAATCGPDLPAFTGPTTGAASITATIPSTGNYPQGAMFGCVRKDVNNYVCMYPYYEGPPARLICYWVIGGGPFYNYGPNVPQNSAATVSCSNDGAKVRACVNGTCVDTGTAGTPAAPFTGAQTIYVGSSNVGATHNLVVTDFKVSTDAGAFR